MVEFSMIHVVSKQKMAITDMKISLMSFLEATMQLLNTTAYYDNYEKLV